MNCNKSQTFMNLWDSDQDKLKRKLTEFSLQLTPTKFADMINYKKILMQNLSPKDIELTVLSDGKEMYNSITDSKIKSLCLNYAKEKIAKLEQNMNEDNENAKNALNDFVKSLEITTDAYGTRVKVMKDFENCTVCINDFEMNSVPNANGITFDIHTFEQGYMHTFVFRIELLNGDMYSFYSEISRGGAKGEKPTVLASAFVDGFYVKQRVEQDIYF